MPYSGAEEQMETKLERIASKSANTKRPELTSLYHLINKEMLLQCHRELEQTLQRQREGIVIAKAQNSIQKDNSLSTV